MMSGDATATTARNDQGGYEEALAAFKSGQTGMARAKLETWCRDHPDHARAHTLLGLCRYSQHDHGAAKEALRKAIALDPRQPDAFYHLGLVLETMGEKTSAKSCFASALSLNPEFSKAEKKLQTSGPSSRNTEIDVPQTDADLANYKKRIAAKKRADFWAENWHKYPLPLRLARIALPILMLTLVLVGLTITLGTMSAMGGGGSPSVGPPSVSRPE